MLPQNTYLGELSFLEIYDFFDLPALFACYNKAGQVYMAVWIDENSQQTKWLYVPVSVKRLLSLRAGQLDLHEVFLRPEDDYVFIVTMPNENEQDSVQELAADQLDSDSVPMPDSYVEDVTNLPRIVWENIDQTSGSSNIISKWLNQYNYGRSIITHLSSSMPFIAKTIADVDETYFDLTQDGDPHNYPMWELGEWKFT